jgi:hypothetical protein
LDPDHKLGWHTRFAQQSRGSCGTLQAADFLEIEDASQVHGTADFRSGSPSSRNFADWRIPHVFINNRKAAPCESQVDTK